MRFRQTMEHVQKTYRMSMIDQCFDMWKCWVKYQILPFEYYKMGLYRKRDDQQHWYYGMLKGNALRKQYNVHLPTLSTIDSKHLTEQHFNTALPFIATTETLQFPTPYNLEEFIRANMPVFVKTDTAYGGKRTYLFETEGDIKRNFSATQYLDENGYYYVVQKKVEQHPTIKAWHRSRGLSTIRFLTTVCYGDVKIVAAVCRLPGPHSEADNPSLPGNIIAGIGLFSGRLTSFFMSNTNFPIKLDKLNGFEPEDCQIPFFEDARKLAIIVQGQFRGKAEFLAIDIAISPTGPVLIEVEHRPDLDVIQIANEEGIGYEV